MTLLERLTSPGPKRILALDGGGIRGALTLGYLEKIEAILRERHGKPNLLLCDYFDLIGGTSTGSIIAAALAIGKEVSEVKDLYQRLGEKVFSKNKWWRWRRWWKYTFDAGQLRTELNNLFGNLTIGHCEEDPLVEDGTVRYIRTGLCVVAKRADTGGTWPLANHPKAMYAEHNRGILLRKIVRASTAAPTYFDPETIDVGAGQKGAFVDGGVSMANNPALQLFLMATLKGFHFDWPAGEDKLLLVSIGTGTWKKITGVDSVTGSSKLSWAQRVPAILMNDANLQNQLVLQYLSRTPTRWTIDREIGDLSGDLLTPQPALTYLRYNALLEENPLNQMGLSDLTPRLESLRLMEVGENVKDLLRIGERAAKAQEAQIKQHIPAAFNLP
jgi:patatin-like phospholipase/acyl hydrolase